MEYGSKRLTLEAPMAPPINRRTFLHSQLAALSLTAFGAQPFSGGSTAHALDRRSRPPNIVLIMADDFGVECLNNYGGTSYKTPHLTELARQGMQFSHCFSTPLCTPTRVQVMTGRYPFRTGWTRLIDRRPMEEQYLDPTKERTFAQMLKDAGYATAVAGKWQLGHFRQHPHHAKECGFDQHRLWLWRKNERLTRRYWHPLMWQNGEAFRTRPSDYGPDLCCDFLIDFMRQNKERPFFAYYPMLLPHAPLLPTPKDDSTLQRDAANPFWFGSMVNYLDTLVGRLVKAVDQLGLTNDTLILFTSDNGTKKSLISLQNGKPVKGGKSSIKENGCHVPLIARWPTRVPPGTTSESLVDLSDVLPTLAELGNAKLPEGVTIDGKSFAAALNGSTVAHRKWVFMQLGKRRAVRDQRWKFVSGGKLYDLLNDPSEARPIVFETLTPESRDAWFRLKPVLRTMQ